MVKFPEIVATLFFICPKFNTIPVYLSTVSTNLLSFVL
jgi:hypothetical protein